MIPSPEQFDSVMAAIDDASGGDTEAFHADADALLVGLQRELGYGAAMDRYEAHDKWYA